MLLNQDTNICDARHGLLYHITMKFIVIDSTKQNNEISEFTIITQNYKITNAI